MNIQKLTLAISISLFMGLSLILMGSDGVSQIEQENRGDALIKEYIKSRNP
jgi:hypothetical protein